MNVKTCTKCHQQKTEDLYPSRGRNTTATKSWCKECEAVTKREYYLNNREKEIAGAKVRKDALRLRNRQFVYNFLLANPCACGESDPAALDFDHQDETDKQHDISTMMLSHSIKAIKAEMAKCTVMCSNCHRKRTAKQMGWYAWLLP